MSAPIKPTLLFPRPRRGGLRHLEVLKKYDEIKQAYKKRPRLKGVLVTPKDTTLWLQDVLDFFFLQFIAVRGEGGVPLAPSPLDAPNDLFDWILKQTGLAAIKNLIPTRWRDIIKKLGWAPFVLYALEHILETERIIAKLIAKLEVTVVDAEEADTMYEFFGFIVLIFGYFALGHIRPQSSRPRGMDYAYQRPRNFGGGIARRQELLRKKRKFDASQAVRA